MSTTITQYPRLSIKDWSVEDRPREKLLNNGRKSLSDAELIAILLGTGTRDESAVELARKVLHNTGNDLNQLSRMGVKDLQKFKGIGEAKAVTIVAAMELGRRRKNGEFNMSSAIKSSSDAYQLMRSTFQDLPHEEFWMVALNRANKPIAKILIGRGGVSGTVADIKLIFKYALEYLASGIIVYHNHPSGNKLPSAPDKKLTEKIRASGKIMDIPLLDHIIITDYDYFSFSDHGQLL